MKTLLRCGLLLALVGCRTTETTIDPPDYDHPDARFVREHAQVDQREGETWVMTAPYFPRGRFGPQASLVARWFPDGEVRYQLYYYHPLDRWANYLTALDADGDRLAVELIGKRVGQNNQYEERVGIWLKEPALRTARDAEESLTLTLVGQRRRESIAVPPWMIDGFLEKVSFVRRAEG
ncbi:MAG: hypothetical protein ACFE0O_00590 [Opitutales bacterium]